MRQRERSRGILFVGLLLLIAPRAGAQQVTGRITDARSGQAIPAVQVSISGTGIGALTQNTGRYLLLNVPIGAHTITAQRIGYKTLTAQITVTAGATIVQDFAMSEEALGLDEIVVTGTPGGTQRRAIGNAVTSVSAAEVTRDLAVGSVQDLLSGRAPGVQFTRISGNVGTGAPMEIRGSGSFNLGSNPVVYVDGIRVNNDFRAGPTIGQGKQVSVLSDFNPQDIQSIEIIKGPAAATLYGSEASAGVVQIITKRGAEGTPQFELSVRQGTNFLRDPAGKIGTYWGCRAQKDPPCRETTGLVPYNGYQESNLMLADGTYDASPFVTTPWPEKRFFQYGLSQSYNLGVRGGTQTIRYFLSGNYDYDQGMEYWNTNDAMRLRANVGVVFNPVVSFDASLGFVDGFTVFGQQARSDGGIYEDLIWGNGFCIPRINNKNACPRLMGFQEHLPSDVARVRVTRDFRRFTGSATLNFNPAEWLKARAIVGTDQGWDENTELYPLEAVEPVYFRMPTGEITVARPRNKNTSLDISGTASFTLRDVWETATSVGLQYNYTSSSDFAVTGIGFASPVSRTVNQTPSALATNKYDFVENKAVGVFVQEQLSWKNRVFVTGAVRFDDNSAFGSAIDPEIYPKLSATWLVSDESFWKLAAINSLRLRGAWGQAGRQPSAFARVTRYGVGDGPFGTSAFSPIGPGNDEVGPERGTELELGVDLALFDGRIAGEFSWFNKRTDDALLSISLAPTAGLAGSVQQNLGRLDNWGWEASLKNEIYSSSDLSFGLDLTGSHVDNEIKSLGDYPGNNNIKIGYPYPNYAYRYQFVDAKWDPAGKKTNAYGQKFSARCESGKRLGEGTQYGLVPGGTPVDCETKDTETVLWGRAFFSYRFGITPRLTLFDNTLQLHVMADGGYGKINHDNKAAGFGYDIARVTRVEDDPLWLATDRYAAGSNSAIYNADFWKLREVGVRYSFPESFATMIGADRASISFSARELAQLWRKQPTSYGVVMVDPEMSDPASGGSGQNNRVSPPLTTLNVDLRVTF